MIFHVTETYRAGIKLPRAEVLAALPVQGQLTIVDWRTATAENRALRVAYLKHPTLEYFPNVLTPLFDPVLVRMTGKGFLLVGWQVSVTPGGQAIEFKQGWWCVA